MNNKIFLSLCFIPSQRTYTYNFHLITVHTCQSNKIEPTPLKTHLSLRKSWANYRKTKIHGYSFPLEETSTSRAHNLSQVIRSVCSNEMPRRTSHSTSLVFRKRYHVWIRRPCQVCVFGTVREPTARISRVLETVVSSRSTFRGRWVHEFSCCFCPSS